MFFVDHNPNPILGILTHVVVVREKQNLKKDVNCNYLVLEGVHFFNGTREFR